MVRRAPKRRRRTATRNLRQTKSKRPITSKLPRSRTSRQRKSTTRSRIRSLRISPILNRWLARCFATETRALRRTSTPRGSRTDVRPRASTRNSVRPRCRACAASRLPRTLSRPLVSSRRTKSSFSTTSSRSKSVVSKRTSARRSTGNAGVLTSRSVNGCVHDFPVSFPFGLAQLTDCVPSVGHCSRGLLGERRRLDSFPSRPSSIPRLSLGRRRYRGYLGQPRQDVLLGCHVERCRLDPEGTLVRCHGSPR